MKNKMNNLLLGGIVSHTERARIHAMNSPLGRAKRGIDGREGGGGPEVHPGQHEPGPPNPNATMAKILENKQKVLAKLATQERKSKAQKARNEMGNKGEAASKELGTKSASRNVG